MEFEFEGFETELEDFEMKKVQRFTRTFNIGQGGSFCFTMMHKGILYAPSGDHNIYAIDTKTGKEVWRFRTNDSNYGTPSTDGKNILVPSYDGNVYALDAKTGKEIWKCKTSGKVFSMPAADEKSVYFGSEDNYVYAVERETGKLIWRFKTGSEVPSAMTVINDRLVFGSNDHNLYCIDSVSGKEIWRFTAGDDVMLNKQVTIKDGKIYFPCLDNYLYCVDFETGKEIWRFKSGKYGNVGPPYIYNEHLYLPTRDGDVYALTMEGKEIWRFRTGGMVVKVIVYDGIAYFGSEDNNFYAIDAETGKEIWRFRAGSNIYDEAKIIGDRLFFAGWDCRYYALNRFTGEEVWHFQGSSSQHSYRPDLKDEYEMVVKKETRIEEPISKEKYKSKKGETVSLSDYQIESEYSSEIEYKQKSDYDVEFIMFEDILKTEDLIWISEDLRPQTLRWK